MACRKSVTQRSWFCGEPPFWGLLFLRILVADEHDVVRHGLRVHLERQPNWQVVGEAADGNDAILNAITTDPDVVVLAYKLPLVTGIEATRQIRSPTAKDRSAHLYGLQRRERVGSSHGRGGQGLCAQVRADGASCRGRPVVTSHKPYFAGLPVPDSTLPRPEWVGHTPDA